MPALPAYVDLSVAAPPAPLGSPARVMEHAQCKPGDKRTCSDGQPCTVDSCDPSKGCVYVAKAGGSCSDGNPCTLVDTCAYGQCKGGGSKSCGGSDACNIAVCQPWKGCTTLPRPNGASCSDGDSCTEGDQCVGGSCQGSKKTCVAPSCYVAACGKSGVCQTSPMASGTSCTVGGKPGTCDGEGSCLKPQKQLFVDGCEGSAWSGSCASSSCWSCKPSSTDFAHSDWGSFSAQTTKPCNGASCFDRIPGSGWSGSSALYLFTRSTTGKGHGVATWTFVDPLSGKVTVWMWLPNQTAWIGGPPGAKVCSPGATVNAHNALFRFVKGSTVVKMAVVNLQAAKKGAYVQIFSGDLTGVTHMWVDNQASPSNGCTVIPIDAVKVAPAS